MLHSDIAEIVKDYQMCNKNLNFFFNNICKKMKPRYSDAFVGFKGGCDRVCERVLRK